MKEYKTTEECTHCENGKVSEDLYNFGGGILRIVNTCPYCKGTGEMEITVQDNTK